MANANTVTIEGRLGKDAEKRGSENGPVTFSVCWDKRKKDKAAAADQSAEVQRVIKKAEYLNPEVRIGMVDGKIETIDKAGQPVPAPAFNSELIRARLEAQERWGIPEAERDIISKGEAESLISKKAIAKLDDAGIRDYVKAAANSPSSKIDIRLKTADFNANNIDFSKAGSAAQGAHQLGLHCAPQCGLPIGRSPAGARPLAQGPSKCAP